MKDDSKQSFAKRRDAWSEETIRKEWEAGVPTVSYCGCCGAQFISQINQTKKRATLYRLHVVWWGRTVRRKSPLGINTP